MPRAIGVLHGIDRSQPIAGRTMPLFGDGVVHSLELHDGIALGVTPVIMRLRTSSLFFCSSGVRRSGT